ncbi:MAG: YetF domain-containing protein [Alphaproteobacteria bacterium]
MTVPWWELILRGAIVYVVLLVLLRIAGKRQVGELAPFDLVLLLILSNAVQNSMNGGDVSLIGGLILAIILVSIDYLISLATYRSRKLETLIEGQPQILIHNGKLYEDAMQRAKISHRELEAALRQTGCASIESVAAAVLESSGKISVIRRNQA